MARLNRKTHMPGALLLTMAALLVACATPPPPTPIADPVDREAIRAALKQEFATPTPGPPPFVPELVPKTIGLDLPQTFYSLTFDRVPLSAALAAIVQETRFNLSVEADVDLDREVTVLLKEASFEDALNMVVRNGAGYAWHVEGDILFIKAFAEKIYAFDYLDMPGETEIQVGGDMLASSVEDAGVSGKYIVKHQRDKKAGDVWQAIEESLDALKSEAGVVRINRNAGVVYLADRPRQLDAMVRFLDALSEALSRQVYIEARILEVRLTDRSQLGIDWSAMDIAFIASSDNPKDFWVDNFNMSFNGGSSLTLADSSAIGMVVDFLRTQGEVSVVSNPHLALLNGRSALLTVGYQFPYGDIDGVDRDEDTKVVTFGTSIKRAILGLQFGISVQIAQGGVVTMNIVPTITRIQEEAEVELPTSATTVQTIKNPIIDLQELSTTVKVREGNTVVLAGLISQVKDNAQEGLPGLAKLPWVGGLFKHTDDSVQTRELVMFITPRMRGTDEPFADRSPNR